MVLHEYLPVILFIGLCAAIIVTLAFTLFANRTKASSDPGFPAEEGLSSTGSDRQARVDVRFYLVAVQFVVLGLAIAFLFPWALSFAKLGWPGLASVTIFLTVLAVGLIYWWKKGAL